MQRHRGEVLKRKRSFKLWFGAFTMLLVPIGFSTGQASASTNVVNCLPGYQYSQTAHTESNFGKGNAIYLYNYNAYSASLQAQFTSTQTLSDAGTIGGSAEVDLIIFTIGGNSGVTVGKSTSESTSAIATVNNIPEHEYGIIQLGDTYWNTAGTYYWLNAICVESQISTVTGRFPENPNSTVILVGTNTTETPPWQQTS